MKALILLLLTACASQYQIPKLPPVETAPQVQEPVQNTTFDSWPNQTWAFHAEREVIAQGLDTLKVADASEFCPNGMTTKNWVHFLAAMIKHESDFDPRLVWREEFRDRFGNYVLSIGLFQVSIESSNGGYQCGFFDNEDIKNPEKNITCGVKILKKLIGQNGRIAGKVNGAWQGGARYFAVLREPKLSQQTIPYLRKWCDK
jgi:hypothetical protein